MKFQLPIILFLFIVFQANSQTLKHASVDQSGIIRWGNSKELVKGFGINYTVPFAHAFRSAKKLGVDPKEAIKNEIYHFKRLEFDLYRVHVWDTEISDSLGNLLDNEHLDTFDFLLNELKKQNINYILTPIAFWGNGWPEPDEETPGFSHKYGKGNCLTNPDAIRAQQNYLEQFMNHINPYNGLAYKDDPSVIAVEVSNEPHHRGEGKAVTEFVKGMVEAIRKSGCEKPIFYNISHGVHFMEDYFQAGIQGGTFQWYPTGLGYQRELPGNFLPNVDRYQIPFDDVILKHGGAKIVYEFDAADVDKSYIYPAMARSFREAGIQLATHFAYDPTFLAYANTEYNTHYMNLAFTPGKALALMISSRVFHELPLNEDQGKYPDNTTFGQTTVNYERNLAEYTSHDTFIYTNNTKSHPKNEKLLNKIAGAGSSPVVKYDGTGAYFLDKIDKGLWRLEVMPDVIQVANPYGRNSLKKTVSVIKWSDQDINIQLQDLGSEFSVQGINEGNDYWSESIDGSFKVGPGVYMLTKNKSRKKWSPSAEFMGYPLSTYFAPEESVQQTWLKHNPLSEYKANQDLSLEVQCVSDKPIDNIKVFANNPSGWFDIELQKSSAYQFSGLIPAEQMVEGFLNYNLVVEFKDGSARTYPADQPGRLYNWDFYSREPYRVRVTGTTYPIMLFNASKDTEKLSFPWRRSHQLIPIGGSMEDEFQVRIEKLFVPDNENLNREPIYDYPIRHFLAHSIGQIRPFLTNKSSLVIKARALEKDSQILQLSLLTKDGSAFGTEIKLTSELEEHEIALNDLKPVKTVTQPRPYPTFLPYFFNHANETGFKIEDLEGIQIRIGPGLSESEKMEPQAFGVVSIYLK